MKKIIITTCLILGIYSLQAQEERKEAFTGSQRNEVLQTQEEKKEEFTGSQRNEIKVDALGAIAFGAIDINYERYLTPDNSIGVAIHINPNTANTAKKNNNYSGRDEDINENFMLSPYYRLYLLSNSDYDSNGFYVEVFTSLISGKNYEYGRYIDIDGVNPIETKPKSFADGAIGIGLGIKIAHKKKYVLDTNLGLGRYFGFNENSPVIVPKFDLSLGLRF